MNKIIATALLLSAGTALSNAADLLYGFDFDTMGDTTYTGIEFTNLGSGVDGATLSRSGSYGNWLVVDGQNICWGNSGHAHSPNGATFSVTELGLDVSAGISLTTQLYSNSGNINWTDYFSLTIGGTYFKIQKKGTEGSGLAVYAADSASTNTEAQSYDIPDVSNADSWAHLGINIVGATWTFYSGETLLGSKTFAYADGTTTLTAIGGARVAGFGSDDGHNSAASIGIDNFGLYDAALSSEDFGYLSNNALVSTIPEPSAFGLLAGAGALALVAARRRRSRKA